MYRIDGTSKVILESEDVKQVESMYKGLEHEWITSTAEKRPFKLPAPEMHMMLPSLISEIKVESLSREEYHKSRNPYYKEMEEKGLGRIMNQNFNNGGY